LQQAELLPRAAAVCAASVFLLGGAASQPRMTPAVVKGLIERRPFKSVVELNKFLLEQKLTPDQAKEFYRKAFVRST
jgi:hypothetical protein